MKTISIKVLIGCLLMVSFVIASFGQTTTKTNSKTTSKKLDKANVPSQVTEMYVVEYPVTAYESWYGYPAFSTVTDWYGYDSDFYTTDAPEYYVVEFTKDGTPYKVIYTKQGKKVATARTIKMDGDVPQAVSNAIKKSAYKNWTITKEKEEFFKDTDEMKVYKVVVEKGNEKHALIYQEDGKLLKDKKKS
jgi:hypothetical protein